MRINRWFFIAFILVLAGAMVMQGIEIRDLKLANRSGVEVEKTVCLSKLANVRLSTVIVCSSSGKGTGTIIKQDKEFIYVLTARHCVIKKKRLLVLIYDSDGTKITKKVKKHNIIMDRNNDLAVVKLEKAEGEEVTTVELAVAKPKWGDKIYSMGHPAGQHFFLAKGIVSNYERMDVEHTNMLMMIANISTFPGNSGGGVYNEEFEFIGVSVRVGIHNIKRNKKLIIQTMSYIMPLETIHKFLKEKGVM